MLVGIGGRLGVTAWKETYLVGLVVVLRVVLEHLLLLRVVPVGQDFIEVGLFPPVLTVDKHLLGQVDVELAGAEEAQLKEPRINISSSA
jgi:hypothetical protein